MQGPEPTHQGGVCLKQSSRRVSPQPVGGVGRASEEQSHQRNDQAAVRASDGERDRVKSYMSESMDRRNVHQNSSLAAHGTHLRHHENDDSSATRSTRLRQCRTTHFSSRSWGTCSTKQDRHHHSLRRGGQGVVQQREGLDGRDRPACLRRCQQAYQ